MRPAEVTREATRAHRLLFLAVANCAIEGCYAHRASAVHAGNPAASASFPGAHWEHADPASAGFSSDGLRAVRAHLPPTTTGFMLVAHGRVILEAGDVQDLSYIASVRKSVLAMLFGKYVAEGRIHLDETLASLGIDDVGGLTAAEKEATVVDLLSSRSGVFHVTNAGGDLHDSPPRGSQEHGTYFLYNNFDFNALGAIFEKRTGRDIYDALRDDLAVPIGMEDFRREVQKKDEAPEKSTYPAYHMSLSTRGYGLTGYLMLREGNWAGQQLVPREWVQRVTTITTPLEKLHPESEGGRRLGYGLLWWVFDDATARAGGELQGAYTGWGAFGQYITVIPKLDRAGQRKSYGEIGPGAKEEMPTFATHAWLLTDHRGEAVTLVVAEPDDAWPSSRPPDLSGR